jgi:hypothetical protein
LSIVLDKACLNDLYRCTKENIKYISAVINVHVRRKEIAALLERKLDEIMYYLNRVYNLELIELKSQSKKHYLKWLAIKDIDEKTANAIYMEYLKLECKIKDIEIPF